MRTNPAVSRLISFIALYFVFAESSAQAPCGCSTATVAQQFFLGSANATSNAPFYAYDGKVLGGRFFLLENGDIGIGVKDLKPLAKLHLASGTSILGGNTLISSDQALQQKWPTIPDNNLTSLWGLWLDKGVVATDYAITKPANWADFVFDSTYRLRPLKEVEAFIMKNKHLPDMPSEQKIKEGYTVHTINTGFMQKIEELTLYTIEQDKKIQELQQKLQELEVLLNELKGNKGK